MWRHLASIPRHRDPGSTTFWCRSFGSLHWAHPHRQGDYDAALATLEEGLALSEKGGRRGLATASLTVWDWLYLELGDLDLALDLNRQSAEGLASRATTSDCQRGAEPGGYLRVKGDHALAQQYLDGVHRLVKRSSD
jgi:tetratricopeptide (TPR) repeat protein